MASWFSSLSGRLSPFGQTDLPSRPPKVSSADFVHLSPSDIVDPPDDGSPVQKMHSHLRSDNGPRRDSSSNPDILMASYKGKEYTLAFPAYGISEGIVTVGGIRELVAERLDVSDPRTVKLTYKGRVLADDKATTKDVPLKQHSEIFVSLVDVPLSANDDDSADDEEIVHGDRTGAFHSEDSGTPSKTRKRNRGKKGKKAKGRDRDEENGKPTHGVYRNEEFQPVAQHLPQLADMPLPKPTSQPRPVKPVTGPMQKLDAIDIRVNELTTLIQKLMANPPKDRAVLTKEAAKLNEVGTRVLESLDGVESEGDPNVRPRRKGLIQVTQGALDGMSAQFGLA